MCKYKPGNAPAHCGIGEAIAGGSHLQMICSKFLAFFVTSSQLGVIIR